MGSAVNRVRSYAFRHTAQSSTLKEAFLVRGVLHLFDLCDLRLSLNSSLTVTQKSQYTALHAALHFDLVKFSYETRAVFM